MPLEGKTVLERVVERVRYCKRVDEVFVLTTISSFVSVRKGTSGYSVAQKKMSSIDSIKLRNS